VLSQGANERTPLLLPPEDSLPTDGIDVQSIEGASDEETLSGDQNGTHGPNSPEDTTARTSPVKVVLVLVVGMLYNQRAMD
jgi:hypothetical protein